MNLKETALNYLKVSLVLVTTLLSIPTIADPTTQDSASEDYAAIPAVLNKPTNTNAFKAS